MVREALGECEGMDTIRMLLAAAESGMPILEAYQETTATAYMSEYEKGFIQSFLFAHTLLEGVKDSA